MTKVMFNITEYGEIYVETDNHAGDHDVCTITSTLVNVLLKECERMNIKPVEVNGTHVRIYIEKAYPLTIEVFKTVLGVFHELESQHPEYIKLY